MAAAISDWNSLKQCRTCSARETESRMFPNGGDRCYVCLEEVKKAKDAKKKRERERLCRDLDEPAELAERWEAEEKRRKEAAEMRRMEEDRGGAALGRQPAFGGAGNSAPGDARAGVGPRGNDGGLFSVLLRLCSPCAVCH